MLANEVKKNQWASIKKSSSRVDEPSVIYRLSMAAYRAIISYATTSHELRFWSNEKSVEVAIENSYYSLVIINVIHSA